MNQEKVVRLMESSKSKAEWNANSEKVEAFYGAFPDYWQSAIIDSGLEKRVFRAMDVTKVILVSLTNQNGHNTKIYLKRGDPSGYPGILEYDEDSGSVRILRGPENNRTVTCTTEAPNVATVEDLRGI